MGELATLELEIMWNKTPPASEGPVFDAKPHQAKLRTVSGSLQCNSGCAGQCKGGVSPGRVASWRRRFEGSFLRVHTEPKYRVRLGQELTIQTENDAAPVKGRITSISPAADTRNRIFAVEVTVSNRDRHLKPGMIASIGLGEVPHSSISIPLGAIVPFPSEPEHFAVMVAQNRAGTLVANLRKVQLGTTHDNSVAVEGVQPGERVVSVGAQLLRDGDPIQVIP
jgi:hypothetical protein